jgi:hypothetical protein
MEAGEALEGAAPLLEEPSAGSAQLDEQVLALDRLAQCGVHGFHHAVDGGRDGGLHLHGLHHQQLVALGDLVADAHRDGGNQAWNGGGDLERIGDVGLQPGLRLGRDFLVGDEGLPGDAVELVGDVRRPSLSGSLTLTRRMTSVLPSSMCTLISSPRRSP